MLIPAFKLPSNDRLNAAFAWLSVCAAVIFGLSLTVAVLRWIGRTNAVEAAEAFTSLWQSRFAAYGRRFGRLQATAMEMSQALDSIPVVAKTIEHVVGERSESVEQKSRGFFMLSRHRLKVLLERSEFRQGLRIRIATGIGTLKDAYEDVLSLVPGRTQVIDAKLLRQARRVVRCQTPAHADFVSSSVVSMLSLSNKLAEAGEISAARSVGQCALRLVQIHISSARWARRRSAQRQIRRAAAFEASRSDQTNVASTAAEFRRRDAEFGPVNPALKEVVDVGVAASASHDARLSELGLMIIDTMLRSTGKAEAVGDMLLHKLPPASPQTSATKSMEIAWKIGLHALNRGNGTLWRSVLEWFARTAENSADSERSVFLVGTLVAASCRFETAHSRIGIDMLVELTKERPAAPSSVESLWHIGASALAAGNISAAVIAAREIHSRRQAELFVKLNDPGRVAGAKLIADLRGGYLGDLGSDALSAFSIFPKQIGTLL
ncbi:hypothetical protein [Actinoplanes sp. ATCC 53533]|uniref:hypothetical protein n=1 Tax=Actinoplanes sp. ATCC 53533 TaxID=1288362 RepID=UPI000F76815E|nr:hypothetical protein [Actinoplanes sp. ATCC 53533]